MLFSQLTKLLAIDRRWLLPRIRMVLLIVAFASMVFPGHFIERRLISFLLLPVIDLDRLSIFTFRSPTSFVRRLLNLTIIDPLAALQCIWCFVIGLLRHHNIVGCLCLVSVADSVPSTPNCGPCAVLPGNSGACCNRTDLLLTITPRVIRERSLPNQGDTDFYSGRKSNFDTQDPNEAWKRESDRGKPPRYNLKPGGNNGGRREDAQAPVEDNGEGARLQKTANTWDAAVDKVKEQGGTGNSAGEDGQGSLRLAFSNEHYSVDNGATVTVEILGSNLGQASELNARVLFNPSKLALADTEAVSASGDVQATASAQSGSVDLSIRNVPPGATNGQTVLAKLTLRGTEKGLSYLLINSTGNPKGKDGSEVPLDLGTSKIEIR